jgi:hypothetical protein
LRYQSGQGAQSASSPYEKMLSVQRIDVLCVLREEQKK